jgi:hypothetical protein
MDDTCDIEDLHQHALNIGSKMYIDPQTGFTIFSELTHLRRGFCCGNKGRHCPYGFENVKKNNVARRPAKLQSGDMETAQRMVQDILQYTTTNTTESSSSSPNVITSKNVPYTRKWVMAAPHNLALANNAPKAATTLKPWVPVPWTNWAPSSESHIIRMRV